MLSTFPAMPSTDGLFGNPFPAFEGGFTPWDCQEPLFTFQQQEPAFLPNKPQEPVMSYSDSENSNPNPVVTSNSGSDDPNRRNNSNSGSDDPNRRNNSNSGSYEPNRRNNSSPEERKRRRMISNRESARRSRLRKQKHVENLRNQVTRHRTVNRELMNQLRLVAHNCQVVRRENEWLQSESSMLREKLWAIHQVLLVWELQQAGPSA